MFREKKNIVRLVLFLLAAAVAVAAFTTGINGYLHRDSGWYDVDYSVRTAPSLFDSGVHLRLYAEGGSSLIRAVLNEAQGAYSDRLLWLLGQLDAEPLPGAEGEPTGVAALNASPGEWVALDAVAENALRDALERTRAGKGFSVFAGPLAREWQTLLYLEDPSAADPVNSEEERALLETLAGFVRDPSAFSLEIEPGRARLTVSGEYAAWAAANEFSAPVLDLGLLRDAYLLEDLVSFLRSRGYAVGYLYTDSGLSAQWAVKGETVYRVPGFAEGGLAAAGEVSLPVPSAFCQFTAVSPSGEKYGYYTVQDGQETVYRHPFFDARTGGIQSVLMTAALGGGLDSIREIAWRMTELCACGDRDALERAVQALPDGVFAAYTLQGEEETLYLKDEGGVFTAFPEEQAAAGERAI